MLAAGAAAGALFVFGRTGGNIVPETITITTLGWVEVDGRPTGRILGSKTLARLQALARKERFAALPSTIACAGVLPDVAIGFVVYRHHRVRERGGCNVRFTTLYNSLYRVSRVQ
jgi:hypothetical protein